MSWIRESEPGWFHRTACNVLKSGPIPNHVAFIMDGNRRYAKRLGMSDVLQGHAAGFEKLAQMLEWCRDLGIGEVTVYAFSIENFKRSEHEVGGLMQLARQKFEDLLKEQDKLEKYQVCIQFFGNLALLPIEIQALAAKIMLLTRNYRRHKLNVCIAYTSQNEISRAIGELAQAIEDGDLEPDDINESLLSKCLDTRNSPDPDLLLRTSGELRFSDFLLWQCTHSCLRFDKLLWPDFSFWHLCYAVFYYQRHCAIIQEWKQKKLLIIGANGEEFDDSNNNESVLLNDNDGNCNNSGRIELFLKKSEKIKTEYFDRLAERCKN